MWVLYFRNTSCCIILSKEAPDAESKSAQIETNSPHVKINFTLDISNSIVPGRSNHVDHSRRFLIFTRDLRNCSLFIQTGLQNRGLYGAYVRKRVLGNVDVECLTDNLKTYGSGKRSKAFRSLPYLVAFFPTRKFL